MTIAQLQQKFLASDKQRIAPEDFFILLAHAAQKEKTFLLAHPEYNLDTKDEILVRDFFRRRLKHESTASIVGHKEFYGYTFRVTKDTLIPRPETELIVDLALNFIGSKQQAVSNKQLKTTVIDVGTGSGNIIISLAKETEKKYHVSHIKYYATDVSSEALAIAKENAKSHNVDQIIAFLRGDLLEPLGKNIFSADEIVITANLPYLSEEIYLASDDGVRKFEPRNALVSDQKGLGHYYRLLKSVKSLHAQKQSLFLFLEISPEQALPLQSFATSLFPKAEVRIHKDLAGKNRAVEVHTR